jgi:hypothetical protein
MKRNLFIVIQVDCEDKYCSVIKHGNETLCMFFNDDENPRCLLFDKNIKIVGGKGFYKPKRCSQCIQAETINIENDE